MKPSAKLLTVREVAERLGLKESTIRKRILLRQIAYVKPGLRAVRIPVEELERILAAGFRRGSRPTCCRGRSTHRPPSRRHLA